MILKKNLNKTKRFEIKENFILLNYHSQSLEFKSIESWIRSLSCLLSDIDLNFEAHPILGFLLKGWIIIFLSSTSKSTSSVILHSESIVLGIRIPFELPILIIEVFIVITL